MTAELEAHVERGGPCEAVVRALLYTGLGFPEPAADERAFAVLRQIHADHPESVRLSLAQFKELVKEQRLMLRLDQERAVAAPSKFLPMDTANATRQLPSFAASPQPLAVGKSLLGFDQS